MNNQQKKIDAVVRAMAQLPDIERNILVLRIQGETYKRIGEALDIYPESANRAYTRALGRLNKILSL